MKFSNVHTGLWQGVKLVLLLLTLSLQTAAQDISDKIEAVDSLSASDDDQILQDSGIQEEEQWDDDDDQAAVAFSSDTPSLRGVPDSTVESLKKQKAFRYANDPSYWQKEKETGDPPFLLQLFLFFQHPIVKIILYVLLGALLIFIIYQVLAVNNFFIFGRSSTKKTDLAADEEEAMSFDLDERIKSAVGNGDLRLAVRYLYLKTLQALDQKNLIRLQTKLTNYEYLQQMQGRPRFNEFRQLTQIYEYVWYGQFEPTPEQFERINGSFNQFIRQA